MSTSAGRPRGFAWEQTERLMPVVDVVPHFDVLEGDLSAGIPVVLTDGAMRVAVIVAWDLWGLQHERYLRAAALSWAHWRSGRFDATGFGWDVLEYLRPPMQERLHPTVHPGEDGGPVAPDRGSDAPLEAPGGAR